MRREPAIVLATALSIIPGIFISNFGAAEAKYGIILIVMNMSMYCVMVVMILALLPMLLSAFKFYSLRVYVFTGLICSLLLYALILQVADHWLSGLAGAISLFSAFLLVPALELIGAKR